MLRRLHIENFKAWRDTGDIRLAPLTVFFGTNSSGKTSLQQMLLLLQQTAQSSDRQRVLHLGDSQSTIDLGTFSDVVHGHGEDTALKVALAWDSAQPLTIHDSRTNKKIEANEFEFHATIRQPPRQPIQLESMGYRIGPKLTVDFTRSSDVFELTMKGYEPVRNSGRRWPLPSPSRFYGFPDEAVSYFQNTGFLADLNLELERLFARLFYVGPLREYPKRLYLWSGEHPEHVGKTGSRAIEALLAGKDRYYNFAARQRKQTLEEVVARWLQQMGLIAEFAVRPIAENRKEYEVVVHSAKGGSEVKLTDVGFGVSQVLPVIVECFYVPTNSIVLFEQPEIHLHPRVQADLADLFIEALEAREGGHPRNLQLLVESHSEHFLRRLQRRIAERRIAAESVALYFCEEGPEGSVIRHLDLDDFGRITNWPKDFFGDIAGDTAAQIRGGLLHVGRDGAKGG
ncbi:DUF3696 domain-containing protein [Nannocystaceae bacterium ST9]